MDVILQTYYIILPIVATAVVGWAGHVIKQQRSQDNARDNGIMMILRYMLQRYHAEYMMHGKMTYNQYQDWTDFYRAYTALGGNSVAVQWNKDIEELEKCESVSDASLYEQMLMNTLKNKENRGE